MKEKFMIGDVDVKEEFTIEPIFHDSCRISGKFNTEDIIGMLHENGLEPLDIFEEEDLIACIKDEEYIIEEDK